MATKDKLVEFGDYLFLEEDSKTVTLAEQFKTLPTKYENLKKTHEIIGRANKQSILIAATMDPEKTIVLIKKTKVKWIPRSWVD